MGVVPVEKHQRLNAGLWIPDKEQQGVCRIGFIDLPIEILKEGAWRVGCWSYCVERACCFHMDDSAGVIRRTYRSVWRWKATVGAACMHEGVSATKLVRMAIVFRVHERKKCFTTEERATTGGEKTSSFYSPSREANVVEVCAGSWIRGGVLNLV